MFIGYKSALHHWARTRRAVPAILAAANNADADANSLSQQAASMPRSNATPTDSTDSLPLTTRSSTDTPPPAPSPSPKRADSADSLETTHETAPMLARWDVGIDDDDDVGAVDEDSAELGLGLGESEGRPWGEWDEPARSHGRGKNRRVYGGGRHGDAMEGGVLGPGEVAGMILAAT